MLKCEQKLLILSFEEEITEVPAECKTGYYIRGSCTLMR